jgi:hypothetical protein
MKRRKNARPGMMTEQAKFKRPIKDCNSLNVIFLRCRNAVIKSVHLRNLKVNAPQVLWYLTQYPQKTTSLTDRMSFPGP